MKRRAARFVIGIDEVGRGALAGPVVVAAVCFPVGLKIFNRKLGALKDSKKLSPKLRELWVEYFKSIPEISYKTARVYPRVIEKINISQAANKAAGLVAERLMKSLWQENTYHPARHSGILPPPRKATDGQGKNTRMFRIFLDGGLYLGNEPDRTASGAVSGRVLVPRGSAPPIHFLIPRHLSSPLCGEVFGRGWNKSEMMRIITRSNAKNFRKNSRFVPRYFASTIVKADEKITAVKVASIIAKVQRDKYMKKLSEKHPRYEFEIHKGYGTRRHIAAIKKYGASDVHRLTFLRS